MIWKTTLFNRKDFLCKNVGMTTARIPVWKTIVKMHRSQWDMFQGRKTFIKPLNWAKRCRSEPYFPNCVNHSVEGGAANEPLYVSFKLPEPNGKLSEPPNVPPTAEQFRLRRTATATDALQTRTRTFKTCTLQTRIGASETRPLQMRVRTSKAAFLLWRKPSTPFPFTAFAAYQWSKFRSQRCHPLSRLPSLRQQGNGILQRKCQKTQQSTSRICKTLWSADNWYGWWCPKQFLGMDITALALGRRELLNYVELWKKTSISGKHHNTQCKTGTIYYESVWWSLL